MQLRSLFATGLSVSVCLLSACEPGNRDARHDAALAATNNLAGMAEPHKVSQVTKTDARPRLPEYVPGELLVKFRGKTPGVSVPSAKYGVTLQAKRVYRSVSGLQLVKLGANVSVDEALAALRGQAEVEYAEPNYIYRKQSVPDDPSFAQQWGLDNSGQTQGTADADIDAREAWDVTTGSASTVVAVIDTGVDYTHPDLAPNMFTNTADCDADGVDDDTNGYVDDCHGIDTASGDSDPMDEDGHGTHVAGIIAARGNNGIGVTGVAWTARVVACRFIDAQGAGNTANAIACLDYVAALRDQGVNIVATNNSWGGGVASRALQDAIDRQRQRGILFVAAAGNARSFTEDHDLGTNGYMFESGAMYPCAYPLPNVICVAASTDHDEMASFSYYGAFTAHVFAPGEDILSTLPGGAYGAMSGTSMATPHVTGVIALLKSAYPAMNWLDARNRVITGGDYITRDSRYPDFGWPAISRRRLNALGALNCLNSTVLRRIEPRANNPLENYAIGVPIKMSVMHVSCIGPAGAISATINPGNVDIPLHDDGLDGDAYAGDGQYSASWIPTTAGAFTLTFPGAVMHNVPDGIGPDDFAINVHPFLKPGFPVLELHSGGQTLNPPELLLANLDGGTDVEIVNSSIANGPNYAWKSDGTLLPGWPLERAGRPYHVGYYSAGDLDGDPATLELAGSAADDGTNVPTDTMLGDPLEAYSVSGQMLPGWPRASLNYIRVPPVMVDFDLDGRDDIFLGGGDGYLRGLRYNADAVPGFEFGQQPSTLNQGVMTPLAADLDADGRPELVLTSSATGRYVLSIINGVTGTAVRRELEIAEPIGLFGIGDVDGDGSMNILGINHHSDGQGGTIPVVTVLSPTGELVRTFATSTVDRGSNGATLADLDQDGIPEVVLALRTFDFYWQTAILEIAAFHGDGSPVPGFPATLKAAAPTIGVVPYMSPPVIGDVDGDGRPEIVANAAGDLYVVNDDGSFATGTPFTLPREFFQEPFQYVPAIADLDGDGRNDIVAMSNYWIGLAGWFPKVFAFDLRGPASHGPIEWGQQLEGPQRRGAYVTGKNLANDAYLAIRTHGEGRVTSSAPAFQCVDHCLRKYAKNSTVTLTAAPTAGGSFIGWRGACAGQGATCQLTLAAYAATSAIFSTKTLSVTVSGDGKVTSDLPGIQCPSICSAEYQGSQTVTLTATPASNSSFVGWSGASCQGANPVCVLPMNVARSVSARFEYRRVLTLLISSGPGTGTIETDFPGFSCSAAQCSGAFDYGTRIRLTLVPNGDRTPRWSSAGCQEMNPVCDVDMSEGHTLSAEFLAPAHITVSTSGGGSGIVTTTPAGIDCGSTCTAVFTPQTSLVFTATPAPDSAFVGWTGGCDGPHFGTGPGECFATAIDGFTVVAHFELKIPLRVTREGGVGTVTSDVPGVDCGATCTGLFRPGEVVRLTATPAAEHSFVSWSGACQSIAINGCVVTLDQAREVTAHFIPWNELVVTVQGGGTVASASSGLNCGTDCRERFAPNDTARITATPDPLYSFDSWSGDCQGNSPGCALNMDQAHSVTARFVPWHELVITLSGSGTGTVNSSPPGISCAGDCREHYAPDTMVTLSASAASGSEFTGWSGACTGSSASCTVTMAAASTATANFRVVPPPQPPPPVIVPAPGGGGGGRIDWWLLAFGGALVFARGTRARKSRSEKEGVGL